MSSMKFKFNKKLKLATEKPMNFREGNRKSRVVDKGKREVLDSSYPDRRKKRVYAGRDDNDRRVALSDDREATNRKKRVYAGRENDKRVTLSDDREATNRKKRVYAGRDNDRRVTLSNDREATNRKTLFRKGQTKVNQDSVEEKYDNRTMWGSSGIRDATSKTRRASSKSTRNALESTQDSDQRMRMKVKEVNDVDVDEHSSLKKRTERKSDSINPPRKAVRTKKGDASVVPDEQPKKKRRVIKLDPYDISNKRLDDGIVANESTKETMKDQLEDEKVSMNAQFRAIKPSPSILSYVEDNLLGRRRLIELRKAGYNIDLSAPLDNIPNSTSTERERIEESIFRNKLSFFAAAKVSSSFPPLDLPEIAFAGRSNVGKSSLLNSLTRQWGVVRTSDKPGHTQTINFFNLGSKICLVDLPGYGFAYAKDEVKDAWEELVKEYVSMRVGLKRVCLLVDTQWGMKPRDHELIDLMERYQTKYQIVLTKTDKVFPIDVARRAMQIEESLKTHKSAIQPLMMVSSKSGAGIQSLRTVLTKIARFAKR